VKGGLPGDALRVSSEERARGGPFHVARGLDLSRRRLDVCLLDERGELLAETALRRMPTGCEAWLTVSLVSVR
jgi:hypothetical protein